MRLTSGVLGWANAEHAPQNNLQTYGPGGRWDGRSRAGDLLADALVRDGGTEGDVLFVISVTRAEQIADRGLLARLEAALEVLLDVPAQIDGSEGVS